MTVQDPRLADLVRLAEERVDAVTADAIALMRIESPSADHAAVAVSADAVAAYLADVLGAEPERITIDGVSHVRLRFGSGPTRVVLLAHHDTVWPHGTLDRLPARVVDGALRGPGSVDMKTGLVLGVHALRILREHGVDLDGTTLLVTGDEELGSPSSRALIEETARGAAAALVLEAGGDAGEVKTERKGTAMYRLTVRGRASHAGLAPDAGINATVGLAQAVLAVAALHASEPGLSVVPTVISGGTTTNTVPAEAHVDVDARASTVAAQLRCDAAIRAIAIDLPGAELLVEGGPNRAPLEAAASAGLFARAQRLAAAHGMDELRPIAVGGGSDGNFTAGIGVPTLDGLGAWGGGAHAEDEHAVVAGLGPRLALLTALVADLLGEEGPR
ncbi:M20/M25/M40 family metallo-hydrolase [Microbacterium sp. ASV81]|uniref:M20/M25/M40 family metallo-hydrolase n=1 Tax=Microbacterium capsulatum TaxID=3041921 RepID=A0ABU0XPT5_9MICO|nr:M20/M25/M40 family metallo-hydrolase [Microbacterium sp. ASV81]MDQ4215780.1 M20/M25/M40 family metallo-hydrolase [Microbacterium sp. ASV81]